jgi:hypothetical protein
VGNSIATLPFKGRAGGDGGVSRSLLRAARAAWACKPKRALQGGMGRKTLPNPIPLPASPLKGEELVAQVPGF